MNRDPAIVDDALAALGLSNATTTDTSVMREVLDAMQLADLRTAHPPMRAFFAGLTERDHDLGALLDQVRWGLIHRAPAVVEFLAEALRRSWLRPSPYVYQAAHVAYVLEAVTAAMCNSPVFFEDYVAHVRSKERDIGIDHEHVIKSFFKMLPGSLNFFGTAKAVSLDIAMVYFRVGRYLGGQPVDREAVEGLHAAGRISRLEQKLLLPICAEGHCVCNDWLRINIYEAGITEHRSGFSDNAMAAHVLAEHVHRRCHRESFRLREVVPQGPRRSFYGSLVDDANYFPVVGLSDEWTSLYLSWNMAFILGELKNLHYLFPKLLVPSLLCAQSDNFLGARIVSLWASINTALLLHFHRSERVEGPAERREMAAVWGEINRRHAEALYRADIATDAAGLQEGFEGRYSRPYRKLGKQVREFLRR